MFVKIDIDVPLSNLDRRFPGASSESCSRPGYDSRQYYNNPSSLEAQIPGRSSASTTTTQSHSTRAHNSYGSIQTEIPPTDPAEAVTEVSMTVRPRLYSPIIPNSEPKSADVLISIVSDTFMYDMVM